MTDAPSSLDRHDPGPLAPLERDLASAERIRRAVTGRAPRPTDGRDLLAGDAERAALMAVLGAPVEAIAAAIATAAGAGAAAAMGQSEAYGVILLREPGAELRRIPAGYAGMNPLLWRDAALLACVARDGAALATLLRPSCIAACGFEPGTADAFWPDYCQGLAMAMAGGRDTSRIDAVLKRLDGATIASPEVMASINRPLLLLARALVAREAAGWEAAVEAAVRGHRAFYDRPGHRRDSAGFLALTILGLCAVAHDAGLPTRLASPYLPSALIDGTVRGPCSSMACALASPRAPQGLIEPDLVDMTSAMISAEALKAAARPILDALHRSDIAGIRASLAPRADDYARVFAPAAVEGARAVYERFWATPPALPAVDADRIVTDIHVAPAGMLAQDNLLSRPFPGGYRAIAPLLDPHRAWVAWTLGRPQREGGLAYDGLVWCDDHWAWFPRPYALLRSLIGGR